MLLFCACVLLNVCGLLVICRVMLYDSLCLVSVCLCVLRMSSCGKLYGLCFCLCGCVFIDVLVWTNVFVWFVSNVLCDDV